MTNENKRGKGGTVSGYGPKVVRLPSSLNRTISSDVITKGSLVGIEWGGTGEDYGHDPYDHLGKLFFTTVGVDEQQRVLWQRPARG